MSLKVLIVRVIRFLRIIFKMEKPIKIDIPNKYAELTKEINSDELLEGFLGFGLFAEKLPDFLTSEPFL